LFFHHAAARKQKNRNHETLCACKTKNSKTLETRTYYAMIQKHVRIPGDDDRHRCSHSRPLTSVVSHTSFLLDHRCWLAMAGHARCDERGDG
jgi:hypothetical protein